MRGTVVVAVLACAGCDRVFGIAELPTPGTVTGTHVARWPRNDATGRPEVHETAYAPNEIEIRMRGDDEDLVIEFGADGTFSFPVPDVDATYRLIVRTRNSELEYQLAARTLHLVERLGSRPDRISPAAGTRVDLLLPNRPIADIEYLSSTGVWIGADVRPGVPISIDWTPYGAILEENKNDDLYYTALMRTDVSPNEHFRTTNVARIPNVPMVQGATTQLNAMVETVPLDRCVEIHAQRKAELDRLIALTPGDYTNTSLITYAAPGPEPLAATLTVVLQVNNDVIDDVVGVQRVFGNPFVGSTLFQQMTINRGRPVADIGTLTTSTVVTVPIDDGPCPVARFDAAVVALPTGIALDGRQLTGDSTVTIDRESVLTWQLTSSGEAEFFVLRVYEVGASIEFRRSVVTAGRSVKLDPTWFESQHRYVLYIEARLGIPNAAIGDFRDVASLWARGLAHTPILTVR